MTFAVAAPPNSFAMAAEQLRAAQAVPAWQPLPHQVPPAGPWDVWILMGGRGAGKTDAGAHHFDAHARGKRCLPGKVPHRMGIIAPSHDDAVQTCVRGESGLLAANPVIRFTPGAQKQADLTWPNGAEANLFGAFAPEDVERFRGPQHCFLWGDEFAAWRKLDEVWDIAAFGLRLGPDPRIILTSTPKRRRKVRELMAATGTVVSHAPTKANPYLPAARRDKLYAQYGGTTLGRQELDAELIDDMPGALWRRALIDATRVAVAPPLTRIVVAIDPSATSTDTSDEAGIVAMGKDIAGHLYVLDDRSLRAAPDAWAAEAIRCYVERKADRIVAEVNNGGEMVEHVVRVVAQSAGLTVPYKAVTASRSKQTRAEPVAALYEQGKVHHVGAFDLLEDEQCSWVPGEASPNRMDALVWAATELMGATAKGGWGSVSGLAGGVA